MEMQKTRATIEIPRELLLVEIERRCPAPRCNARVRIGLTKDEARSYAGFECERCNQWSDDQLTERDVPEWWEELKITGLEGLRSPSPVVGSTSGEVVTRMSDAYREKDGAAAEIPDAPGGDN
jgi:hypothetical protein